MVLIWKKLFQLQKTLISMIVIVLSTISFDLGLVTNYGGGGGACEVLPLRKGGGEEKF